MSEDRTTTPARLEAGAADSIRALATQLRVDSIRCSTNAGSGHPTSSLSAADLMAVLLTRHLRYDWERPSLPDNDHLIFSKGHASPLLYSMYRAVGVVEEDELLNTYRQFGARLQGHPTPVLPWVDVATGSLGQGLPVAVGVSLAGRYLDKLPFHTWVLCGDSELAEGSIWEALDKAAYYKLGNLTAVVDVNRLGQDGPTELQWDMDAYARRVEAFGARAIIIDGHDLGQIDDALSRARSEPDKPTVILAKTIKGKGVPEIEDQNGWHGKALPADMAEKAIAALGGPSSVHVTTRLPESGTPAITPIVQAAVTLPQWKVGDKVATRAAFGAAVSALAVRPEVVVLDGEVGNSTHAGDFKEVAPERYFEIFIAEQQLVAATIGLSVRGYVAFASSFAAFLVSRPFDFIRMAGVSEVNIRLVGTHAGVEIGQDGPSQMALEDIAAMRAVHSSTVLYPADAPSTAQLVSAMADTPGISYLRATRGAYPVIYRPDERFPFGGSKVHGASGDDQVALIGAGVTLHECLAAAEHLAQSGIKARVIDLYSIKPIDVDTLRRTCLETDGRIVVAEDHYAQGGIGSAVLEALASANTPKLHLALLAVRELPGSGEPNDLLNAAGISARHIAAAARDLVMD
ncbi:transketolase [Arthrobacter sp. 2MCAF14]|uniref:transketolase n=1 Tax=Arthrobacter sp. 2MCAF14 TaxID=3232982 RepID=UPI003F926EF3